MRRALTPLLLVVALVTIAAAGYWLKRPADAITVRCSDPVAGCTFGHGDATARVRFSVRPTALETFDLSVHALGAARVRAEFQMVGMDMGFNRYDLQPSGDGLFVSSVTLPVCISGRHDWILYLELDDARYAIPFTTQ